jgi:Excalibur calcium-binding domain
MGPVKLPPLPGRLNTRRSRQLVWLVLLPLLALCCLGAVLGQNPTPPAATQPQSQASTATAVETVPPPPTTDPAPTTAPRPRRTTRPPTPRNDPRYKTCKEAKAHGYGPYRRGVDPEYAWYIDADHDGVTCE